MSTNTTNPDVGGRQGRYVPRRRTLSKTPHPDSALIDRLGGTQAAAVFFQVTIGSTGKWRHTGLPRARMMYLRAMHPEFFTADQAAHEPAAAVAA